MAHTAYQATEEDIENVLRNNWAGVANSDGRSFATMAEGLLPLLDLGLIERAALYGNTLDQQTNYANEEIARQLRDRGVLEPLRSPVHETPDREFQLAAAEEMAEGVELQNSRDQTEAWASPAQATEPVIQCMSLSLTELDTVLDCAERYVRDIEGRIDDGELSSEEASDFPGMQAAVEATRRRHLGASTGSGGAQAGASASAREPKGAIQAVDLASERLISLLDHSGGLESENIQRAAYELRLATARALGDSDRAAAAQQSLDDLVDHLDGERLATTAGLKSSSQNQPHSIPDASLDPEFRRQVQGLKDVTAALNRAGSIGKHDWFIGNECEDGFLVFVDDRPLSYRRTPVHARELAFDIIGRLVADGDYRLNDRPAGFLPPPIATADSKSGARMIGLTVRLQLECKNREVPNEAALLQWIHGCLNCNTNHIEASIAPLDGDVDGRDNAVPSDALEPMRHRG